MRGMVAFVLGGVVVLSLACGRTRPEATDSEWSSAPGAVDVAALEWETSWDAAFERARAEDKLVVVDFHAAWSAWSVHMAGGVLREPKVEETLAAAAVPLRLDVDDAGRELAREYRVEHLPTLLILAADGTELRRLVGVHRAEGVVEAIEKAAAAQGGE